MVVQRGMKKKTYEGAGNGNHGYLPGLEGTMHMCAALACGARECRLIDGNLSGVRGLLLQVMIIVGGRRHFCATMGR